MKCQAIVAVMGLVCAGSLAIAAESAAPVTFVGLPLLPPPEMPTPPRQMSADNIQQRIAESRTRNQQVRESLIARYPELFQGPQQTGLFLATLLVAQNGQVLRAAKLLLPEEQLRQNGNYSWQPWQVNGGMSSNDVMPRGTTLQGKQLRIDVAVSYTTVPQDYDESRSVLRVQDAVLAKHADLLRPQGRQVNWLRVLMNEDGTIARHHVEMLELENMTAETRVGPRAYDRLADQFQVLGLKDEQMGLMGQTSVEAMADGTPGSGPMFFAPPSFDASGRPARETEPSMTQLREARGMIVSYVWPRRASEPAGGAGGRGMSANRAPALIDRDVAKTIVQRAFPDVTDAMVPKGRRPVVVLSQEGSVVRAGYVEVQQLTQRRPSGEVVASGYNIDSSSVKELVPGAVTRGSFGDSYPSGDGQLGVTFMWLAPESQQQTPLKLQ